MNIIASILLETFFSTIFVNYSKTQYLRNSQLPENFLRRKYNENAFDLPIFSIIIYALTGSPSIKFDVCKLSTDRDRNEIRARKKVTSQALFVRSSCISRTHSKLFSMKYLSNLEYSSNDQSEWNDNLNVIFVKWI